MNDKDKSPLRRRIVRITIDFVVDAPGDTASGILGRIEDAIWGGCEHAPSLVGAMKIYDVSYSKAVPLEEMEGHDE